MTDFDNLKGNNISVSTTGLPLESGAMLTSNVDAPRPLPCVVILIHGVNDAGEAFENLDKMICKGLNRRLGRKDLKPNKWRWAKTSADDFSPRIEMLTEWQETVGRIKAPFAPKTVKHKSYSPIIPFTWGYRPVKEETYKQELIAYCKRLQDDNIEDPELPYDSYLIDRDCHFKTKNIEVNKLNCDKFGNWIDYLYQRNGGPFANATTCIPDMYGPGMAGLLGYVGKKITPILGGDVSYDNPHRIYYAFAAHRLAKLIKQIRKDTEGQDIPINIVAHSQGTIITMLANLILANDNDKPLPADCVILAHSPYAFEPTYAEETSKDLGMGVQSKYGREQTFINFVDQMYNLQGARRSKFFKLDDLIKTGVINTTVNDNEIYTQADGTKKQYDRLGDDKELFYRDNFGKVYQYFSPNDQVVSLSNVQGMGWQGIHEEIFVNCKNQNLKQRIFSHGHIAGNDPIGKNVSPVLGYLHITEKDYPSNISVKDYKQRLKAIVSDNKNIELDVMLLPEQLASISEKFSEKLIIEKAESIDYGMYTRNGHAVKVFFSYNIETIKKYFPSAYYEIVVAENLDSDCKKQQINNNFKKYPNRSVSYDKLESEAKSQCSKLRTGRIITGTAKFEPKLLFINGELVPETMIYTVDQPKGKTALSRAIHYNDIYNSDNLFFENIEKKVINQIIDRPDYIPEKIIYPFDSSSALITNKLQLKKLLDDHPEWDRGIESARYIPRMANKISVNYCKTQEQIKTEIGKKVDDEADISSHHSGITNSLEVPAKIMAYDLAIGVVKEINPNNQGTLNSWRAQADWHNPYNPDSETVEYAKSGKLPKELKRAMNYPSKHMPEGEELVVNDFYHVELETKVTIPISKSPFFVVTAEVKINITDIIKKLKKLNKKNKKNKKKQWPLPTRDLIRSN